MLAIGRKPNIEGLGLDAAGVETGKCRRDHRGRIFAEPVVDNIYAVGDVTNRVQLTPVAIHEAMCLIDTLYRDKPTSPDHDMIATAVFSQPEIGTVGPVGGGCRAPVRRCRDLPGRASVRLRHTLSGRQERMLMKLVGGRRKPARSRRRMCSGPMQGEDGAAAGDLAESQTHQGRFRAPNHGGASIRCRGTRHHVRSRATGSGTASGSAKRRSRHAWRRSPAEFRSAPIRPAPATACRQSASGRSREWPNRLPAGHGRVRTIAPRDVRYVFHSETAACATARGVPHGSSSMPIDSSGSRNIGKPSRFGQLGIIEEVISHPAPARPVAERRCQVAARRCRANWGCGRAGWRPARRRGFIRGQTQGSSRRCLAPDMLATMA